MHHTRYELLSRVYCTCPLNTAEERIKKTKELLRAVIVAAASSTV